MTTESLPTGTITFLITDIQGSTRLVQDLGPERYGELLSTHHRVMREAIAAHGGIERGTQGDSFLVIFRDPAAAAAAAVEAQRSLASAHWPNGCDVRVRMGLHTGQAIAGGDDYVGVDINRAARIAAAAHGGQILVSDATKALVERAIPADHAIRDLGEHRLKDLDAPEHLFQLDATGLATEFPAPTSIAGPGGARPVQTTPLVGRTVELAEIRRLLDETRLLTLIGPGGTGKTRLMLAIADEPDPRFPDGTFLVELAPIADPGVVGSAVAAAIGLQQASGKPIEAVLTDHLRNRRVRLLLDNFEHLTDAATLVDELLRIAPGLQVVVTSQVQLRLSSEQLYQVPPLSLPEGDADPIGSDAVQLFAERAAHSRPEFRLTAENAPIIAAICRRLDGLPLAIELAAARVRILPLDAILVRLESVLGPMLASGSADLPERHRTLRAAFEWSYGLLGDADAAVLRRLSVFAGGASLEAIEAVAGDAVGEAGGDVLTTLDGLVGHSLVVAETAASSPRFSMLETIREFAGDALATRGEADDARRRHALWCCELVEANEAAIELLHASARMALQPELENLRAALRWARETGEIELGLLICAASWRFWKQQGQVREALEMTRAFVDRADEEVPVGHRARGLAAVGGLAYWMGDRELMRDAYRRRLALAEEWGDASAIADAHFDLIFAHAAWDDAEGVDAEAALARRGYEATNDQLGIARCDWIDAGMVRALRGEPMDFKRVAERVLPRFREGGDLLYVGLLTGSLAWSAMADGDMEAAHELSQESLAVYRDGNDIGSAFVTLEGSAVLLRAAGKPDVAAQVDGAYAALRETYGVSAPPGLVSQLNLARARTALAHLPEPEEEANRAIGRRMTFDQVVSLILQET